MSDERPKINFRIALGLLERLDAYVRATEFADRTQIICKAIEEFLNNHTPKKNGKK